jgi:acyl carrier protein
MRREEIVKKLEEIFSDLFDEEISLSDQMSPADIEEWDSLMQISILAAVQDEFDVSFEIDEIVAMKNVGDIVAAIREKI